MSSELTVRNFVDMVERIAARGTCSFCKRASEQCGCFPCPPYNDDDPPSYLPAREPLPPRIPELCPDDEYRTNVVAKKPTWQQEMTGLVQEAIRRTGLNRRNVRVEYDARFAVVKAFVSHVNRDDIDAIMHEAIMMMPLGIGIDVQSENAP